MEERRCNRARVVSAPAPRALVPPTLFYNTKSAVSVRVALYPAMSCRIVARDHAINLAGVADDAVPVVHSLGAASYFGPLRAMFTMRRADTAAQRAIWMEILPEFAEDQPMSCL